MSDSAQPETRTARWAPLAVDPGSRASTSDHAENGAVLRSPADAATASDSSTSGLSAWPWDVTDTVGPRTATSGPAVATEQLYRDPVDPLDPATTGAGTDSPTQHVPVANPAVDPFALRASNDQMAGDDRGMKTWGVVLVDLVITTVAAIVDLRLYGQLTWITGGAFVLACLVTSLSVRRRDLSVAVITPPLAFVAAVAISAQTVALGSTGSLMLREGKIIVTSLAFNAPYVFAGTGLALVIVALRALRRAR